MVLDMGKISRVMVLDMGMVSRVMVLDMGMVSTGVGNVELGIELN